MTARAASRSSSRPRAANADTASAYAAPGSALATYSGVALGDVPGDRADAGACVPLQGADGSMARAGQPHRGASAAFGVVCQGIVAEPVEGPAVQVLDVLR
ncbi:hypothetical protein ACIHCQ_43820 [Streptomyces sp. NPDC052236]|uniref:hypothetical protein n=1 Tax=Streptomyces sp. NPDC052236 TaxID=3365686 RepID=UPI0037D8F433